MGDFRKPVIGGVAGGVGTSIVAAVVEGTDAARLEPGVAADVIVCRSTASSVLLAQQAIDACPTRLALVVVADSSQRQPKTVAARLRMVEPHVAAIVRLPWIAAFREHDDPVELVRDALGQRRPTPTEWTCRDLTLRERAFARLPLSYEAPVWATDLRRFKDELDAVLPSLLAVPLTA